MIFATFNRVRVLKAANRATLYKIQALSVLKWQRPFTKRKFAPLIVTGNWPPYPTCSYWSEIMIQTDYISLQFNIYYPG